ncbi:MAG: FAD-dependent oxidoreductase [Oscillospiraceae bacterium]|nr:FAD-dependent oxidoreductase [Oscillospiraceae bacterium]
MKILVAGAGHGGLAAAGILAGHGADVTVIERFPEENLGYDWTDIFNLKCFREAGIPMPGPEEYGQSEDMTFISPSREKTLKGYAIREPETEVVMERRAILRHLIAFARERGVTFMFGTTVIKPLLEGNRVTGLTIEDTQGESGRRDLAAELVIDAAGMDSPLRSRLPEALGFPGAFRRDQYFTVYRAHFKHTGRASLGNPFSVYFFPLGRQCINWIAEENGAWVDQLCGSFGDTDRAYAGEVRRGVLERHPTLGGEILRGDQVVRIPVRRPLSRMVADGYALVGDSAAMTVPLVGSGIANAIRAGKLLAETVLACAAKGGGFTAPELWPYQVSYMRQIGAAHASLDVLKGFVLSLRPAQLDFIFRRELLGSAEMTKARTGQEIALPLPRLAKMGLRGAGRPVLLLRMAGAFAASRRMKRHAMRIPKRYEEKAVAKWAGIYEGLG